MTAPSGPSAQERADAVVNEYRRHTDIHRYDSLIADSIARAIREAEAAVFERCAGIVDEGCVQIGCTAIEAEGLVRTTRDVLAAAIRAERERGKEE